MIIRTMQKGDVAAVAALEAQIFPMPWSAAGFADTLPREDIIFLVAYEQDELLGYVGIYCMLDEGEITNVAVAPAARRRGIARALLTELKQQLACRNVTQIVLEVRVSNEPAIRLYEQMGFSVLGVRKNFYEKPTEDAYIMACQ